MTATTTARERLKAGDLQAAISAQQDAVRAKPADARERAFLADLLCFAGDLDRADTQLDALVKLDAAAAPSVALGRQLVRAETWRRDLYRSGRMPELLETPTECVRLALEAAIAAREGRLADAAELCARAESARPRVAGVADGAAFDDLRDADDVAASVLEILTSTGKLYWIAFDRVESIEFAPLERTRDLLWRRANVSIVDGPDGEVWLPAIYPSEPEAGRDDLRLGRVSEWIGGEGSPVRGVGLRTWIVGDEARTIHDLARIEFASPRGGGA